MTDKWKWFLGGLGGVIAIPVTAFFTLVFLVYRVVTWPFRLVKLWIRSSKSAKIARLEAQAEGLRGVLRGGK